MPKSIKKGNWIILSVLAASIFFVFKPAQSKPDDLPGQEAQSFVYTSDNRPNPFVPLLNASGSEKEQGPSRNEEMDLLLKKVKVNGVFWDDKMPLVMINDKIHKQGDVVGNLKIKEIKIYSVVFSYYDLSAEIFLIKKQKYYDQGGF